MQKKHDWGRLADENRFLLFAAQKAAGLPIEDSNQILDEKTLVKVSTERRDQYVAYWSGFRTLGMKLSILEDLFPDHKNSAVLAERIASRISNYKRYFTTQELAWAVTGLGKRVQGKEIKDKYGVKLSILGREKKVDDTLKNDFVGAWHIESRKEIEGEAVFSGEDAEQLTFLVTVNGYQKGWLPPENTQSTLKVSREYFTSEGKPLDLKNVKQGQLVVVKINLDVAKGSQNIAVVDRLPSGFEVENPKLGRSQDMSWIDEDSLFKAEYVDMRDDRVQFFGSLPSSFRGGSEKRSFYYMARAVTQGRFFLPPAKIELMYDPYEISYSTQKEVVIQSDAKSL